uniref:Variant surface glycoprotein 1125.1291 n=1 Tax=Trypanosoma brucei TaxID=5691 RepID=A0A1J0R4H8_9TRYP|nr:variant surface glycoprotein 1125.1291 [Trypanosoma brucei]
MQAEMFRRILAAAMIAMYWQLWPQQQDLANDTNAVNVADLELLCHIMNFHGADDGGLDDGDLKTDQTDELEKLNMSLSIPSWQERFPKEVTDDDPDTDYCKAAKPKQNCTQAWNKWKKEAAALKHPGSFPTKALQTAAKLTSPAGATARLAIANLLEQANSLRTEYSINVRPEITAAKQVQRGTIQHAIFAKAGDPSAPGKMCAAELQTDRTTSCKADKAAATVCGTALCICAKDSDGQSGDLCSGGTSNTAFVHSGSPNPGEVFESIWTKCGQAQAGKLTSLRLTHLIRAFRARLQTKAHASGAVVSYGTAPSNNDCRSENNKGCADFTLLSATKASSEIKRQIWIDDLESAAETIRQGEVSLAKKKGYEAKLKRLLAQAHRLDKALSHEEIPNVISATQPHPTTPDSKQGEKCRQHKPKKTCE